MRGRRVTSLISANVHSHHFIIRATQFGPELQVLLAALGPGNGRPGDLGLSRTDALNRDMSSYVRSTDTVGLRPTWKADAWCLMTMTLLIW